MPLFAAGAAQRPSSPPRKPLELSVGEVCAKNTRPANEDKSGSFFSPFGQVFIVADGMGGHNGGARAAAMVVEGFDRCLNSLPLGYGCEAALQEAARRTNYEIYSLGHSGDPELAGMGSTVVLAVVQPDQSVVVAHAGDSRAYLMRADGSLHRCTRDHSMIQRMIDDHMISEEDARNHPDASRLNRAFGQELDLRVDVSAPFAIAPGDRLVLCSDGLCGYATDEQIAQELRQPRGIQEQAAALFQLAVRAESDDNVTVQILQFGSPLPLPVAAPALFSGSWLETPAGRLALFAVPVLLLAGALLGWQWYLSRDTGHKTNEKQSSAEGPKQRTEPTVTVGLNDGKSPTVKGNANDVDAADSAAEDHTKIDGRATPKLPPAKNHGPKGGVKTVRATVDSVPPAPLPPTPSGTPAASTQPASAPPVQDLSPEDKKKAQELLDKSKNGGHNQGASLQYPNGWEYDGRDLRVFIYSPAKLARWEVDHSVEHLYPGSRRMKTPSVDPDVHTQARITILYASQDEGLRTTALLLSDHLKAGPPRFVPHLCKDCGDSAILIVVGPTNSAPMAAKPKAKPRPRS